MAERTAILAVGIDPSGAKDGAAEVEGALGGMRREAGEVTRAFGGMGRGAALGLGAVGVGVAAVSTGFALARRTIESAADELDELYDLANPAGRELARIVDAQVTAFEEFDSVLKSEPLLSLQLLVGQDLESVYRGWGEGIQWTNERLMDMIAGFRILGSLGLEDTGERIGAILDQRNFLRTVSDESANAVRPDFERLEILRQIVALDAASNEEREQLVRITGLLNSQLESGNKSLQERQILAATIAANERALEGPRTRPTDPLGDQIDESEVLREALALGIDLKETRAELRDAERDFVALLAEGNLVLEDRVRVTEELQAIQDALRIGIPAPPGSGSRGQFRGIDDVQRPEDIIRRVTNQLPRPEPEEVLGRSRVSEVFREIEDNGTALVGSLFLLDEGVAETAGALLGATRSIQQIRQADGLASAGGLLGAVGLAGFGVSVLGRLFGNDPSPAEIRQNQILEASLRQLEAIERGVADLALGDFFGADLGDFTRAGEILDQYFRGPGSSVERGALVDREFEFLAEVARTFGIELQYTAESFRILNEALDGDWLDALLDADPLNRANLESERERLLGTDPFDSFQNSAGRLIPLINDPFIKDLLADGLTREEFEALVNYGFDRILAGDEGFLEELGIPWNDFLAFLGEGSSVLGLFNDSIESVASSLLNVPEVFKIERARLEAADAIGAGQPLRVGAITVNLTGANLPNAGTAAGRAAAREAAAALLDAVGEEAQSRRLQGGTGPLDFAVEPRADNPNVLGGL